MSSAGGRRGDLDESTRRFLMASRSSRAPFRRGRAHHFAEANIGSIFGIGFPAWTGGAMQFIASEGRARFLANAAALADRYGDRFAISADTLGVALRP